MPTRPLSELTEALTPFGRVVARARVVYDGLGLPRADGAVTLQRGPGVNSVVAVGPAPGAGAGAGALVALTSAAATLDCGFAISPPVVNAHVHLGLPSRAARSRAAVGTAVAVDGSAGVGPGAAVAATRSRLAALAACGTRVIGAVVADAAAMEFLLAQDEVGGVAYWEVVAPREEDADAAFDAAIRDLARFAALARPGGMRVGLAPHAPHTVSAPLLARLAGHARAAGLPLAVHVAGSPAERALHLDGSGPLAAELAARGATFRGHGGSPVAYLAELGVLDGAPTLVRAGCVDEDDVRLVARAGAVVVHTPRADAAAGCDPFPWTLYARHGVELAFGTESLEGDSDVDVTVEVATALAAQGVRLNPRAAVRAAVKGGHKALGMAPPRVTRGAPAAALVAWGDAAAPGV